MSFRTVSALSLGTLLLAGVAIAKPAGEIGIKDADYSLPALIAAAKNEPPITVVDATGKIVVMAEAFTKKYGIKATGVKMSAQNQEQVILREATANNVHTDVFNMSDLPSVTSEIIPQGAGLSWMPPDLKDKIPLRYQSPAITSLNPWVWAYNSEVYADKCPISNVWALTTAEWKGRIAMPDPRLRNETLFWFNQIQTHDDAAMRKAYEEFFGQPLQTQESSATAEWVKRLAKNRPSVTRSDSEVGPIIGAKGQAKPFMGFVSTAIFRDARNSGYKMSICTGLKPWVGELTPRVAVIASGTKSPNAAKLFVHYMLTEEGMAPQLDDGKISSNQDAKIPENEASGVAKVIDQLYVLHSETSASDYSKLQNWQDFWLLNSQ